MIRIRYSDNSNNYTSAHTILIFFVICILIYILARNLKISSESKRDTALSRINDAIEGIKSFSEQNEELKIIIENYLNNSYNTIKNNPQEQLTKNLKIQFKNMKNGLTKINNSHNTKMQPSLEYEQLRRRFRYNTQELLYYFNAEFEKIRNSSGITREVNEEIHNTLELGAEYKRSILSSIDRMRLIDGYEIWRQKEAEYLSDLVQRRLYYLQNPKDCKNAKKLACGYGCQLHHLVYCFIVAYATERTMIIKSKGWRYHTGGWEEVFQPASETCTQYDINQAKASDDVYIDAKVLMLPVFQLVKKSSFLAFAIPEDLAPRLIKLQTDPVSWWLSQFYKYLLKPNYETQKMLETTMAKLGWKKPIVGLHIPPKLKITKVPHHSVEEYMKIVEDYYLTLEMDNVKIDRRIFLATDDSSVIAEIRKIYPQYIIISDIDIAKTAGISTPYSNSSFKEALSDIHMLALSDYLVCTFSSNLCRSAYGMMQKYYPDAYERFKSLDMAFSYGSREDHYHEVILPHKPHNKDELEMEVGDLLHINNNFLNGFTAGYNLRTQKKGLFLNFKVKYITKIAKFPTYPNVDLKV